MVCDITGIRSVANDLANSINIDEVIFESTPNKPAQRSLLEILLEGGYIRFIFPLAL